MGTMPSHHQQRCGGDGSVSGRAARSYRGGDPEATALTTVVRETPNLAAILAFGEPSAASLLINAQSSKVITLQSSSAHFSSADDSREISPLPQRLSIQTTQLAQSTSGQTSGPRMFDDAAGASNTIPSFDGSSGGCAFDPTHRRLASDQQAGSRFSAASSPPHALSLRSRWKGASTWRPGPSNPSIRSWRSPRASSAIRSLSGETLVRDGLE